MDRFNEEGRVRERAIQTADANRSIYVSRAKQGKVAEVGGYSLRR